METKRGLCYHEEESLGDLGLENLAHIEKCNESLTITAYYEDGSKKEYYYESKHEMNQMFQLMVFYRD